MPERIVCPCYNVRKVIHFFNARQKYFNSFCQPDFAIMPCVSQNSQRPRPVVPSRLFRLLLLSCAAFYLVVCTVMAISQRSLIYHPSVFVTAQVDQMALSARLERWTNSTGQFIGFKRLSPKQPAVGAVLVAYGNGSTATGSSHDADDIQSIAAFDVFILEYPGYEDRPGPPSERNLFNAADEALQMLSTNKPVYLVGESLGTGVASHLAGTYPERTTGVVLLSPFNCLSSVAQNHYPILPVWLLLVDRFPSEDYLRNYRGPVGVVVDGDDRVVPEKFGLRLYNGFTGPKRLWEFPLGGHTDILEPPWKFWKEVVEFWQTNIPSRK
jgi:pimeloyl-ACP methyl ester carboxylesterase